MAKRKVYMETFGCQMNDVDSGRILTLLSDAEYECCGRPADADLVVFNTCSIREKADQKFYSALGRLKGWKKARSGRLIAVGGCLAQQEGWKLKERAPHVDVVFGTHNIGRVSDLLKRAREGSAAVAVDFSGDTGHWDVLPYLAEGASSAMVTIMQGCDNHCAYCIVPHVRGREISRPASEILSEIRALAGRGVREAILLGQNVNSYGRTTEDIAFPELLRRISRIDGIRRIRFVTAHPRDLGKETIGLFSELEELCPHVHLPVQSGSDRVLHAMGRGYDREKYLTTVDALRRARPGVSFSSDFIVGFPGETEEDFLLTLDLMEEVRFDSSFSFRFSPRPGTRAAAMTSAAVPAGEASERLARLQSLQKRHTRERLLEAVGRDVEVLVEGTSARNPSRLSGRTPCYKVVNFPPANGNASPFRRVRVTGAGSHSLVGEEGGPGA